MTCKAHNKQLHTRVIRSAQHYLDNLEQHAQTKAVIITVEACGCINMNSTLSETALAATLMKAAGARDGETDH